MNYDISSIIDYLITSIVTIKERQLVTLWM